MWISFRKFQEQMTESCYPSVPLSLQFNCSMSLYSLSVQSNQKKENNQEVHLSLRNKNKTKPTWTRWLYSIVTSHVLCLPKIEVLSALSHPAELIFLIAVNLWMLRSCFLSSFSCCAILFFFFSRYDLKTHVDQFFSISSCFPKFSHVDVPQKRKQV